MVAIIADKFSMVGTPAESILYATMIQWLISCYAVIVPAQWVRGWSYGSSYPKKKQQRLFERVPAAQMVAGFHNLLSPAALLNPKRSRELLLEFAGCIRVAFADR